MSEPVKEIRIFTIFGDGGMHAGRVSRGRGYEMKFSQFYFEDYATLDTGADRLIIRKTPLEWTLNEILGGGHDAVKCDSTDAFFLRCEMAARGTRRIPFLIVESDLFERGKAICRILGRTRDADIFGDIVGAEENLWLTISESYRDFYVGRGVPERNIFPFPMARSSIGFSFPETASHIACPLPENEWSAAVRAIRGNVLAVGTNERDYTTLVSAARGLGKEVHIISDLNVSKPIECAGVFWHNSMPASQYVEAIRQSLFVVIPLKPAERNFGQMGAVVPMALGKAVVATEVKSLREHVLPGVTGEFVPPSDPDALRAAMKKLIASPELRDVYGKAAVSIEEKLSVISQRTIDAVLERTRNF